MTRCLQLAALLTVTLMVSSAGGGRADVTTAPTFTVDVPGNHFARDHFELDLIVDLGVDPSPVTRISIQAPAQFALSPDRDPGSPIGQAEVFLDDGTGLSRRLTGAIAAAAPRTDDGCGSGTPISTWTVRVADSGKTFEVPISVSDVGGTRLDVCPPADEPITAVVLRLANLAAPKTAGVYRWSTIVTPGSGTAEAYELRADVSVPHVLSLHGNYRASSHLAVLTGAIRTNRQPQRHALVEIIRLDRTAVPHVVRDSWAGATRTDVHGAYRITVPLRRTQGFVARTPPSLGPCTGASLAPAGCRTTTGSGVESDPITVSVR